MTKIRSIGFALACLFVLAPVLADPPDGTSPKARAKAKARVKKSRTGRDRPLAEPPACPNHQAIRRPRRPPAQSMPEMFDRMMESFERNPVGGFQDFAAEMGDSAVAKVPLDVAEERRLGKGARAEYLQAAAARGFRRVEDPARVQYLHDLVVTLARRMRHRARYPEIAVSLIDAPDADGQSFPGGYLVFTTGLLKEPDEATVAGVVAHELAHLDRGHLFDRARRYKLSTGAFQPPGPGATFDQFMVQGFGALGAMFSPFGPAQELEADCTAAAWLYQEGYDPRALVGFFERLHAKLQDQPDNNPFFRFGRTHPYTLDRRREVLDRTAQLRRWRLRRDLGLYPDNLRRLVVKGHDGRAEVQP
jgi:predicted Zn-dependent protease